MNQESRRLYTPDEKEVDRKYFNNFVSGSLDLTHGRQPEFRGFDEGLLSGASLRLFFTPENNEELEARIIKPIDILGMEHGVSLFTAIDLWEPHVTLAEFRPIKSDPDVARDLNLVYQQAARDPKVEPVKEMLAGQPIVFDSLKLRGTVAVAARNIPTPFLDARETMRGLEQYDLNMKDATKILHSTLVRYGKLDEADSGNLKERMRGFRHGMGELHKALKENPIVVTVARAEMEPNRNFEARQELKSIFPIL